jgi:hypothetical protein
LESDHSTLAPKFPLITRRGTIVRLFLFSGFTSDAIATPSTLIRIAGDFCMAKKGQTFKRYTEEFKLAAVLEYLKDHLAIRSWLKSWRSETVPS